MLDLARLRVIDAVARHGSVTEAAKALHYSQPSVSHHLARLQAETGAQLLQRVGRGIRLTEAGRLLADRAAEIIGRVDAADAELSAHVGLTAGKVRLAGFSSAIGSLFPRAMTALARKHPGLQISLTDVHPPEALQMLRSGQIDVAVIFRYAQTPPEPDGIRLHHLLDDPIYLLSDSPRQHTCPATRVDLDRWMRTVSQPLARPLREARLHAQHRLHQRRHRCYAIPRSRRARRDNHSWPRPSRPPRQRNRRDRTRRRRPPRLRRDLRRASRPAGNRRRPVRARRRRLQRVN